MYDGIQQHHNQARPLIFDIHNTRFTISRKNQKKHEKIQYSVPILNLTYSEFKRSNVQKDAVGSIFFFIIIKCSVKP